MRHALVIAAAVSLPLPAQTGFSWTPQSSGVTARLRGISAASHRVVWASGSDGTILRTQNGGDTWQRLAIPDAAGLDFRDIDAVNDRTAYALSIGPGDASRIYKTSDAGRTWTLQFRNDDPKAFFDAMAFRDGRRGFAFSDSVDGAFVILRTEDGGALWSRIPASTLPPALPGEGAYAASGTNVVVRGDRVWIGTTASRVLRSSDGGRSWSIAQTPVAAGPSAGIFSVAFRDASHGLVVGGDFKKEQEAIANAALTVDGGRTWTRIDGLSGYRSGVAYAPGSKGTVLAVGPSGSDASFDGGRTWKAEPEKGYHAIGFAPQSTVGWAVGEQGRIARIHLR